ncbi:bacillithiol biosynthesis cysteine-adding enzyme BshC [Heyndrickxia sporothermodurans]|uniref:bacillithiol biosynthesis cysteine-adding enzyme BshC n=1 Tax=Heyndrickxia sporothermodurans TaxID=46224 RepID=UPI002DB7C6A5|nr:bacillithiol biosynthesis cysteine-adding enzyme BshC [Heyndrickxia sporothermodurans]MEB6551379.1 bacillithiol biosynthesis cysteine-adding enzyme BshC [Heyndrickxia sporothermodurans]
MELETISIPATNRFASLYIDQKQPVKSFFHYDITNSHVFEKRLEDLHKRNFARDELANCIETYMERFPKSGEIKESLLKLKLDDSSVVIGGQQAGLLTGPLYTIHKIISIIHLAKQQEEKLGKPVVPIFWIAGEDHDYLEINHVFVVSERSLKKISYSEGPIDKRMVSDIVYDKNQLSKWIKKVFEHFGETVHTKNIMALIDEALNQSKSLVDFFTYIVVDLFKDYGLLVIDSADKNLRQLEVPFFQELIENQQRITDSVIRQQTLIKENDFPNAIDISENALNLFYYNGMERILLEYQQEKDGFVGKNGEVFFTKNELLDILEENPSAFSNNVVTRPIMQEWLFPTLAFIAGPGEIAYWGELKLAFEGLQFQMPPIIPRLNISLLERSIESDMNELNLDVEKVIRNGLQDEKQVYWDSIKNHDLERLINESKAFLETQYKQMEAKADKGLLPIVEKNLQFHQNQLDFLQRKADIMISEKNDVMLERYNRIERLLKPNGAPQERIWNIYYFLNKYGETFIDQIMTLQYQFDGKHKLIRI